MGTQVRPGVAGVGLVTFHPQEREAEVIIRFLPAWFGGERSRGSGGVIDGTPHHKGDN